MKSEDFPREYRDQIDRQLAPSRRVARSATDVEQNLGDESVAAVAAPKISGRVSISYVETRKRLADPDGSCTKYFTDALVTSGILRDDSAKEIAERPSHRQVKAEKGEEEKTVIEIWGRNEHA